MVYQCQDDAETGILKNKVHKNQVIFQNFILLIITCFLKLLNWMGKISPHQFITKFQIYQSLLKITFIHFISTNTSNYTCIIRVYHS